MRITHSAFCGNWSNSIFIGLRVIGDGLWDVSYLLPILTYYFTAILCVSQGCERCLYE